MENVENTAELEQQENENLNGDENQSENEDNQNQIQEDKTDWKSEALKYKAILDRNKDKFKENKASTKSDDFDYGKKAFLSTKGINGVDEVEFTKEELKKFNGELDLLVDNPYFQSKLEDFRAKKKSLEATPNSTKRANQSSKDSVDYWLNKPNGELPEDFELRKKVVRAKRDKDSKPQFNFNN